MGMSRGSSALMRRRHGRIGRGMGGQHETGGQALAWLPAWRQSALHSGGRAEQRGKHRVMARRLHRQLGQ